MRLISKRQSSSLTHSSIRYDYDSKRQELVIRMPSAIHDMFLEDVKDDIKSQLKAIGNDDNVDVARNIKCKGSTDIKFETSKHSPDASFGYRNSKYPHLVIEVSYTQKQKDLKYLADTYIVDSNESIGVVIGLDIEYRGTKKAMLSVWRPNIVTEGGREYLESQGTKSEVRFVLGIVPEEANRKSHFEMKTERVL